MQVKDRSLDVLRRRLLDQKGSEIEQIQSKEGVLYRKAVLRGQIDEIEQLIVPKPLRVKVLQTANDIPLSGHLGIKKTLNMISQMFFWPGIRKDMSRFCKSCEVCQRTSNIIPSAELQWYHCL